MKRSQKVRDLYELATISGSGWFCDDPDEVKDLLYKPCALIAASAYKKEKPSEIDGYSLIESTEERCTYKKGEQVIVGFRGTTNMLDIAHDVLILFDSLDESTRFRNDLEYVESIESSNSVVLCGHSLGGTIAYLIAEKLGLEAYIFNPGFPPKRNIKRLSSRIHVFRVRGDPVSAYAENYSKVVSICATSWNLHGIQNFVEGL